jgi:SAM-dependent methyltransferase
MAIAKTQRATQLRRRITAVGLLPVAFVAWRTMREWSPRLVLRNRRLRKEFHNRTRIPPGNLIFSATGTRDVNWFLESGEQMADAFRSALESIGRPIETFDSVFELGCGCGRVLRQWTNVEGPMFFGSDYNPAGIEWAKENIGFASLATNDLEPPLRYTDGSFDLCYAASVFTHLPEHLQQPWLTELHRVLRPGGILMLTLSGKGDLVRVTPEEQGHFEKNELVVVDPDFAGTNICGVYHPESYVRKQWASSFKVLRFIPEGALGCPKQDLYVLERAEI